MVSVRKCSREFCSPKGDFAIMWLPILQQKNVIDTARERFAGQIHESVQSEGSAPKQLVTDKKLQVNKNSRNC